MAKKSVIIFSGFNQRAVISFIRTLESFRVSYGIIAHSSSDTVFKTIYRSHILAVRDYPVLDLYDLLDKIRKVQAELQAEECLIAPSSEALNRFLLKNKDSFYQLNCHLPLVEMDLYRQISDKKSFSGLCVEHGIRVPVEYMDMSQVRYPFVAKPKIYFSIDEEAVSPLIIFDSDQASYFYSQYDVSDFYFQEYVVGESYYLLYYFYSNGEVVKLSQWNHVQQPRGKSILAAETSLIHESEESMAYEILFQSLKFRGLVMVEVRKTADACYMIEANPRFWGPSQLFVDAGVNLFEHLLYEHGFLNTKPVLDKAFISSKYLWFGGFSYGCGLNPVWLHSDPEASVPSFFEWLNHDVYGREDTRGLFVEELRSRWMTSL